MAIPFSVGTMAAAAAAAEDGILAWWRGSSGQYQDTSATIPSVPDVAVTQEVNVWLDTIHGYRFAVTNPLADKPDLVQSTGINGQRCVDFTGAVFMENHSSALLSLLNGNDKGFVLMMVLDQDSVGGTRACFTALGTTGSPTGRHLIDTTGTPQFRAIRRANGGSDTTLTFGTPNTSPYVRTHIFSGTTLTERINGVQVLAETAFDVDALTVANLILGATNLSGANPLDARVGEALLGRYGVLDYASKEAEFAALYAI